MKRIKWTPEIRLFLRENYAEKGLKFCAESLNLPIKSVCYEKDRLGLKLKRNIIKVPDGFKICSVCGYTKPLDDFAKDGKRHRADCKICNCESRKVWQKNNLEKVLVKNDLWRKKNAKHFQKWKEGYKPRSRQIRKERYAKDSDFREKTLKAVRIYRNNPKNKLIIRATQRRLNRTYQKNPHWRAMMNLRRRMSFVLAGKRKAAHSIELLGCTREELRAHLERQFTSGMTWDNYGVKGWHIDHVKPCASFDLTIPEQQKICFHYTNLQPLWAKDNLEKGDNYQ